MAGMSYTRTSSTLSLFCGMCPVKTFVGLCTTFFFAFVFFLVSLGGGITMSSIVSSLGPALCISSSLGVCVGPAVVIRVWAEVVELSGSVVTGMSIILIGVDVNADQVLFPFLDYHHHLNFWLKFLLHYLYCVHYPYLFLCKEGVLTCHQKLP